MKITYLDGTVVEALMLSRGNDALRAAVPGEDDTRAFTLVNGNWVSEEYEPVQIAFAWDCRNDGTVHVEADCICSKNLAFRLMSLLVGVSEELLDDMLWVSSPDGQRVRMRQSPLDGVRRVAEPVIGSLGSTRPN